MDAARKQQLIDMHRDAVALHGCNTDALHWASRGEQKLRFKVLAGIGIRSGDSLLDVGCGFADLRDWLRAHAIEVNYTGVDLSPEIVAEAARRHPDAAVLCGELFDFDSDFAPKSFDWVVCSGMFNWRLRDEGAYACRVIARMFELSRFGVAFNMLDARSRSMRMLTELVAFDPDTVLEYCGSITPDCTCLNDYLAGDFTIHMRRFA